MTAIHALASAHTSIRLCGVRAETLVKVMCSPIWLNVASWLVCQQWWFFFQDRTCDDGSRSDSSSISDGYIANNRRANADVDIVTQLGSGKIRRRVANAIGTVQYAVLTDA